MKTERFEFRLTPQGRVALEKLAKHFGLSQGAVIEQILAEECKRKNLRVLQQPAKPVPVVASTRSGVTSGSPKDQKRQ
jgi:hypothetical protein